MNLPPREKKWVSTAIILLICIPIILFVFSITFAEFAPYDRSAEFIPSPNVAESAIKSAMEAWKRGDRVGLVEGTKPAIQVVDSHRKPGQVLTGYEILGEVPGNAPRCFAVRVQLANPEKEERLRYIVIGIDPLWVFRHEDYDMICHWAHPMDEKKPSPAPAN